MRKATSTNLLNQTAAQQACSLNYTLELIGGRWKAQTLLQLTEGCNRFSLMKEQLPGISDQELGAPAHTAAALRLGHGASANLKILVRA